MNKKIIVLSLFCAFMTTHMHASEETHQQQPLAIEMDDSSPKNSKCWQQYEWCPQPYTQWSCGDRCKTSLLPFCLTLEGLGIREALVCQAAARPWYTCTSAHYDGWCTGDSWCYCNKRDICGVVVVDGLSTCTITSLIAALCILSPLITNKGLNCIKKRNHN